MAFEGDVKNVLYNIGKAKQVLKRLMEDVRKELGEQQMVDKFYDEGLLHVKNADGESVQDGWTLNCNANIVNSTCLQHSHSLLNDTEYVVARE